MSYTIRLQGLEIEGSGDLVLSALQLFDASGTRIDLNASLSSSHSPKSGALAHLQNEDQALVCRFARADVLSPGFFIDYVFPDVVTINGIRWGLVTAATSPVRITLCGAGVVVWDLNGIDVSKVGLNPVVSRGETYLSKVSALLWADGSGIKERSPFATRTWSAQGAVAEVESASAVDSHTFRFASTGSYLTTPGTADLNLSGDWTIEMRFKTSKAGEIVLIDKWQGGATWQLSLVSGVLNLYVYGYTVLSTKNLSDGQYHDIAVCRRGNELTGFVDSEAPVVKAFTTTLDSNSVPLSIGGQVASRNSAYDFVGDIDYVRITNGVARYAGAFDPLRAIPVDAEGQLRSPRINAGLSAAALALASDVPHGDMPVQLLGARNLLDAEFGGRACIYGSVSSKDATVNTQLSRRVRLFRSRDGVLVRETWSKHDGSYRFDEISERYEYDVEAWDHEKNFFSVVANNQLAEVQP